MKRVVCFLTLAVLGLFIVSCKPNRSQELPKEDLPKEELPEIEDKSVLVAYFSRADENYSVGTITKGNTEIVAEMIAEEIKGTLFHIIRETPYPKEYSACTEEAQAEKNQKARPKLLETKSIEDYDIIFLGYPIWWGDMPMAVYTFLESQNWEEKTIIPFCTHEGSGLSGTVNQLKLTCTGATVLEGLAIRGSTAQKDSSSTKQSVEQFLKGLTF
ncbi:MAG: NAD(P)H-dependent oxidoreductase [Anaeroplasmataceae bacterium]|nr:NAD(P)H-dependent oxidoreductase [Anaeroplasmataceae bacterium]